MAKSELDTKQGLVTLRGAMPPMPAVQRILARYDRKRLEAFISVAIDLIDTMDGDADLEDVTDLEDDFSLSWRAKVYGDGAGCAVSDAGGQEDEDWFSAYKPIDPKRGAGCPIADAGEYDDGH